jgi:DNA-binding beta-propeller fold protein YncE
MNRLNGACSLLMLCLSATVLTGCAGTPLPSAASAPQVHPASRAFVGAGATGAAHAGRLFVADYQTSQVFIYPAGVPKPAPVGSISKGVSHPLGLAVDRQGTLYVQNGNDTITEYPDGGKQVSKTLTEVGGSDGSVAVGSDGTVYAAGVARVLEFVDGSTKPKQTLRVSEVVGLALDGKNDLYIENRPCAIGCEPGNVFEFEPGSRRRKNLGLAASVIAGLAVDEHGDLLVGGFQATSTGVLIFKPGSKTPFRTIDTERHMPYQFALGRDEKHLYLSHGFDAQVNVYDYATGALAWTVTQGLTSASGVALSPQASH